MSSTSDPLQLLADLGVRQPTSVTAIEGGWDTSLWRVEADGTTYALRVFRAEQARICQREAVVMRELRGQFIPVPTVHAVNEHPPALLLGWCRGRPVLNEMKDSPLGIWRLGVEMGKTHAHIHAVALSEPMVQALPAMDAAAASSPKRLSLLHLDFHPLNVMTDGREITGVLDWANAAVGDYRLDLARTITLLRLAPLPPDFPSAAGRALRVILEAAWRRGYRDGQRIEPFRDMDPYYVWAGSLMERDLRPKLGKPGVWLRQSDLLRIHRWTVSRRQRARLPPDE